MGTLESILSMIPGLKDMQKYQGIKPDEKELVRVEAIIDSMTLKERLKPAILNGKRRQRIAKGSGTSVQEVNRLMKQYEQMRKMMRRLRKGQMKGRKMNPNDILSSM